MLRYCFALLLHCLKADLLTSDLNALSKMAHRCVIGESVLCKSRCYVMLHYVICYMLCYVMLCYVMLCFCFALSLHRLKVDLLTCDLNASTEVAHRCMIRESVSCIFRCYVMLCYVMLCYIMLRYIVFSISTSLIPLNVTTNV